ncbi:MAG: sensor histidine kinase [Anaerolineae bacterium]|jgi:two-component system sensor histidine kinase DegS|nr:sensor histidine kinase [Anaerolineae bacterium]
MSNETVDYKNELDETQRALREINLMMEQSQGELSKLTQRNTAITSHLQQVQKQGATAEELKMAYDSALDAQQRLFVMRGQLDKLQNDKSHLDKYRVVLDKLVNKGNDGGDTSTGAGTDKAQMTGIEMIVNAQESERQRLSRQMHDGPAQALSNFILQTEIAMRLLDIDAAQAKEELANLKASAMGTFQKVRSFIFELRPMMLDDLGLVPTLRKYADSFKEQSGMDVSVTVSGSERRLEPYLEVMLFRAAQELLGNASRHSQATVVKIHLDLGTDFIRISVDDNGRGFDPETLKDSNNLGLKLIRERSEMLGGKFEIDSALGSGAKISFTVQAKT